jgi:hypothetical protein
MSRPSAAGPPAISPKHKVPPIALPGTCTPVPTHVLLPSMVAESEPQQQAQLPPSKKAVGPSRLSDSEAARSGVEASPALAGNPAKRYGLSFSYRLVVGPAAPNSAGVSGGPHPDTTSSMQLIMRACGAATWTRWTTRCCSRPAKVC